ncbi:MAG: helix-turn-helix transcriptional regulator [Spirochaetales bacterium]|nr:helix-turn-helix transcriptional regulator [Candidatus Physcosoma equi]
MLDKIALLFSVASLVIVSMDMSLSIVLKGKKGDTWVKWNIVLCATFLGLSAFFVYNLLASYLFEGMLKFVLTIVFRIIFMAGASFILVLLCRFAHWMLVLPMSRVAVILTFLDGLGFLVVSGLNFVYDSPVLARMQSILAGVAFVYCLVTMIVNYRTISNVLVKKLALVFAIVSLSCLPFLVSSILVVQARNLVFSFVELAYSIVYLTFMFISLDHAVKKTEKKPVEELTVADFAEFHITDREFEVIKLIRTGMTNKEIAYELGISVNTVNNHIANIFQKCGVRSRIDLLNVLSESIW